MSAETLKFFEEKSTEQIIDWMMLNLRDDQIRACLDESGIPDTSAIRQEPAAAASSSTPIIPAAAAAAASSSTTIVPNLPSPARSSTLFDIAPQVPPTAGSSIDPVYTQNYPDDNLLDDLRRKCQSSGLLINAIKDDMVEFYQVTEVEDEDEDIVISENVSEGEYGWIKKIISLKEFTDNQCDDSDVKIYEEAKEKADDKFTTNIPEEVMEVARIYIAKGITAPFLPVVDITSSEPLVITDTMKFVLDIQRKSPKIMEKEFKVLYDLGLTFFPVFIYGEENEYTVKYLATVVDPVAQKLKFEERTENKKLARGRFKQEVAAILEAYNNKNYIPSSNIANELKELQNDVNVEIKNKLDQVYDPLRAENFTYFGEAHMSDSDEEPMLMPLISRDSILNDPSMSPPMSRSMSPDILPPMLPLASMSLSKKKKPSEMSIPELEEHMKIKFGPKFARDYKPELYTNSIGVRNVRYVKRDNCDIKDNMSVVSAALFPDFASELKSNNFGDMDDSNSELLFGSHCDDD